MESSGEFLPQPQVKRADRQGELTAREKLIDRMRAKLIASHNSSSSLKTSGVKSQPLKVPQAAQGK